MSAREVDVLVSSPDGNFRALARAVLCAAGRRVVATSVVADRVPHQVRLRSPRVLLLDGPAPAAELRRCAATAGTSIVLVDESRPHAGSASQGTVSKWAPAAELVAVVEEALTANGGAGDEVGPRLRLVES